MAYLAPAAAAAASSLRSPIYLAASSRRRSFLPAAVKATASAAHPILSSLRMAASAAVLLAATSPALACALSAAPPPPTPLTASASPDDTVPDASESESESHPFERLIIETACLVRIGGADEARARLAAAGCGESYARLLAAQALFVDGKVDEAIAALEELSREDPADYRPLFCQGVLYLVLGREAESQAMLERCREVGGDTLIVATMMVTPAVEAESGEDEAKPEPEPAQV